MINLKVKGIEKVNGEIVIIVDKGSGKETIKISEFLTKESLDKVQDLLSQIFNEILPRLAEKITEEVKSG